jgi:hypothetical protein
MAKKYQNKNQIFYGEYTRSNEEFEAYRWCIRNGIIIFPESKIGYSWAIEIKINGKISKSPEEYKSVEVWKKVYEYYIYYYNKYGIK